MAAVGMRITFLFVHHAVHSQFNASMQAPWPTVWEWCVPCLGVITCCVNNHTLCNLQPAAGAGGAGGAPRVPSSLSHVRNACFSVLVTSHPIILNAFSLLQVSGPTGTGAEHVSFELLAHACWRNPVSVVPCRRVRRCSWRLRWRRQRAGLPLVLRMAKPRPCPRPCKH
jgi:hypothetical protein